MGIYFVHQPEIHGRQITTRTDALVAKTPLANHLTPANANRRAGRPDRLSPSVPAAWDKRLSSDKQGRRGRGGNAIAAELRNEYEMNTKPKRDKRKFTTERHRIQPLSRNSPRRGRAKASKPTRKSQRGHTQTHPEGASNQAGEALELVIQL